MSDNSTNRFSHTVSNYIKYRPGYPTAIISFLNQHIGLSSKEVVADVGSGTGKLTQLFLENNNPVYAVEPNGPMRLAAEDLLKDFPNLKSVEGTAENTNLSPESIDIITCAQAFHWFNISQAKNEFQRILKPHGKVLLIWNKREDDYAPFMESYNDFLLNNSTDYQKINLRRINHEDFQLFFGHSNYELHTFDNEQLFDLDGLMGRYFSCSYAYKKDHPAYGKAKEGLISIFNRYQENDRVVMKYKVELYIGQLVG